jgi:K+-sensing histidine kinase KdpD
MRRAISNLVDNAVKYGGMAAVTLASEADRVVILVEDEGPGIPRSEREKVFEPFYRIDSARDSSTGGVGLGLSVMRSIVWEHGGDVTLGNRKGGGLSVRMELPSGPRLNISTHGEIRSGGEGRKSVSNDDNH